MKLDMDFLREQTITRLKNLWQPQYDGGGYRHSENGYVSIMGTSDAAWIFRMLHADDEIALHGKEAADWLIAQAKPDGSFHHDYPSVNSKSYRHSDGHAFWMLMRALNIYGKQLPFFPEYLKPLINPSALDAWFGAVDWQSPQSNHHNILGLIPLLCSVPNPAWGEVFFRNLASQQDSETCTWCDNHDHITNVSRTFAYTCMFMAAGKLPPNPDRLMDTILKFQRDSGIWERRSDTPEFHTMDASFILIRLGNAISYPLVPRVNALSKTVAAMNTYFASRPVTRIHGTHLLEANLHTVGLLQEILPECYQTSMPWSFDWDNAGLYRSAAMESFFMK